MKVKCLVTFVSTPWSFNDDDGAKREGITVEYLLTPDLKPTKLDDGSKGCRHIKESLSLDKLPKIMDVPGYYDLEFGLKPGSKGKIVTVLEDMSFVAPVMESGIPFETGKKAV